MKIFNIKMCLWNTMPPTQIMTYISGCWPWRMTLTLTCDNSICVALWDTHACLIWSEVIANINKIFLYIWPLTFNYDPDIEFDTWPIITCNSMRYTCLLNMKSLSLLVQKLRQMLTKLTYIFDLWPLPMTLTLTHDHSICAAQWDEHACLIWKPNPYLIWSYCQC